MIDLDQLTLQSYSVLVSEFFRFLGTACKPHRIGKEDTGLKNVKIYQQAFTGKIKSP